MSDAWSLLNTLYVMTGGSYLHLDNDTVRIEVERETRLRVPLHHLGGIVVFGDVIAYAEEVLRHRFRAHVVTAMYLASMNSAMPCFWPPSRPRPLCLTPPKGAAGSDISPRLSAIMPDSILEATRMPLARSRV